jgi:hypothetical protein
MAFSNINTAEKLKIAWSDFEDDVILLLLKLHFRLYQKNLDFQPDLTNFFDGTA